MRTAYGGSTLISERSRMSRMLLETIFLSVSDTGISGSPLA
jgi:hypothetical protein